MQEEVSLENDCLPSRGFYHLKVKVSFGMSTLEDDFHIGRRDKVLERLSFYQKQILDIHNPRDTPLFKY